MRLDSLAINTLNDDGPHHRWSTGLLFDNIKTGLINVQNRADSGSGHGWTGAQVMLWAGRIWAQLEAWAGQGSLADYLNGADPTCSQGILSGGVCCEATCGACGGSGCGSRPGGSSACCTSNIRDSGRVCDEYEAPCVLP